MENKKEVYVVGVLETYEDRTEIKYVTDVQYDPKVAKWDAGKPARESSKELAKYLAWALCVNGYTAILMLEIDYLILKKS